MLPLLTCTKLAAVVAPWLIGNSLRPSAKEEKKRASMQAACTVA